MGEGEWNMRKAFMTLTVVAVLVGAAPALGQAVEFVIIEVDQIVRGAEGEMFEVAAVDVEPRLVGATCTGNAGTENNASEHPNNDLIIASGGDVASIPDFERIAGQTTFMTGTLVLGDTVTVSIRLGRDRVASGGVFVTLSCIPVQEPPPTTTTTTPPTTTTTTAATTTTTTTTTTQPPERRSPTPTTTTTLASGATTTTELPPVGAVAAGGGGEATAVGGESEASRLGVAWTIAGFLALLGALALAAGGKRRISRGN